MLVQISQPIVSEYPSKLTEVGIDLHNRQQYVTIFHADFAKQPFNVMI